MSEDQRGESLFNEGVMHAADLLADAPNPNFPARSMEWGIAERLREEACGFMGQEYEPELDVPTLAHLM